MLVMHGYITRHNTSQYLAFRNIWLTLKNLEIPALVACYKIRIPLNPMPAQREVARVTISKMA